MVYLPSFLESVSCVYNSSNALLHGLSISTLITASEQNSSLSLTHPSFLSLFSPSSTSSLKAIQNFLKAHVPQDIKPGIAYMRLIINYKVNVIYCTYNLWTYKMCQNHFIPGLHCNAVWSLSRWPLKRDWRNIQSPPCQSLNGNSILCLRDCAVQKAEGLFAHGS